MSTKISISESGIIYIPEEFETLMDFGSQCHQEKKFLDVSYIASRFGCFLDIVWDNFVLGTYANAWDDCPGQLEFTSLFHKPLHSDYGRYKDAISGIRHPCQSITYRIYPYCLPPLNIASSSLCKDVATMLCYMFSCFLQMKQIAYGPWGCIWNFEKHLSQTMG